MSIMRSNGVPIHGISDTVGHKSTYVTETVYRHVNVPAIRGGAAVMDSIFDSVADDASEQLAKPRARRHLVLEQRLGKTLWSLGDSNP